MKNKLLKAIDIITCLGGTCGAVTGIMYGVTWLWAKIFDLSDEAIEAHPILGILKLVGYMAVCVMLAYAAFVLIWNVIFEKLWNLIDKKFPEKKDDFE